MYKAKKCPICGKEFSPKSARQKYCNSSVVRNCIICGKEYTSVCSLTYSKCCSKQCTTMFAHQQSVAAYANTTKSCILCGKEFIPKNNTQQICEGVHFKICVICGKSFEINWKPGKNIGEIAKTCSSECKARASFIGGNPAKRADCREKARQTMQARYGVDHPMHSEEIKKKVDATQMARYGAKRFTQTNAYIGKAITTNQERYGTDWARQNPEVQKKSEDTLFEHYSVTNPMQSDELRAKVRQTYYEHTGYDNPMHNPEILAQIKENNIVKYGVEYPWQNPEIRKKFETTMANRYGVSNALQADSIKAKQEETNRQRYGYDNPAKSPEIQAKISNTMLEKYGYVRYSQTDEWHLSVMTDPTRLEFFNQFKENPKNFIHTYFVGKPTLEELCKSTGVGYEGVVTVLDKWDCRDDVAFNYSTMEREVAQALMTIDPNINIVCNTHKLIYPYEIDIYLPDYAIGIECNPTVTHNSSIGFFDNSNEPKPSGYHKNKSDLSEAAGIFLFHIFGYDWKFHQDIIISMLRNLLRKNLNRVYARNTIVKELSAETTRGFLNQNHRQGNAQSSIRLGLYDKQTSELVSIMTFGKLRKTIGTSADTMDQNTWELVRFCSKLNTTVVGGADKLFKYFANNYTATTVISFSDRAHTRGNLYPSLGFVEVRRSHPNYVWVNLKTDVPYHRINAQKRNIKKFLKDDTIDLNMTEREIMESHGYVKVYDSGTITWEWRKHYD